MDKQDTNPNPSAKPDIPYSSATVDVKIIDTTTRTGNMPGSTYMSPAAHYPQLAVPKEPTPSYSFLISHEPSGAMTLFDLGLRTDWKQSTSPVILKWIKASKMSVEAENDVATILEEGGIDPSEIDTVVFSHQHFDHTGDTSRFPKAKIVVGPGYVRKYLPGWPDDRKCWETTSDLYRGREVVEIPFSSTETDGKALVIGSFRAYDYFGDGSLYLLDTPGHTVGHMSALARTTATEGRKDGAAGSTFIFLGGDVAHNCALFRPNHLSKLPGMVELDSGNGEPTRLSGDCIATHHRLYSKNGGRDRASSDPFCTTTGPHHSVNAAQQSINALSAFDGLDHVFTVLAHDATLLGVVEMFPRSANDWKTKGWKERCQWSFLEGLLGKAALDSNMSRDSKM